jgi:hypothetical protein
MTIEEQVELLKARNLRFSSVAKGCAFLFESLRQNAIREKVWPRIAPGEWLSA